MANRIVVRYRLILVISLGFLSAFVFHRALRFQRFQQREQLLEDTQNLLEDTQNTLIEVEQEGLAPPTNDDVKSNAQVNDQHISEVISNHLLSDQADENEIEEIIDYALDGVHERRIALEILEREHEYSLSNLPDNSENENWSDLEQILEDKQESLRQLEDFLAGDEFRNVIVRIPSSKEALVPDDVLEEVDNLEEEGALLQNEQELLEDRARELQFERQGEIKIARIDLKISFKLAFRLFLFTVLLCLALYIKDRIIGNSKKELEFLIDSISEDLDDLQQEEWIGDLWEMISDMEKSGYPIWKIQLICRWEILCMRWAAFKIAMRAGTQTRYE